MKRIVINKHTSGGGSVYVNSILDIKLVSENEKMAAYNWKTCFGCS